MKRNFIKPAKKNPKFWEIEVTGNSYTITEGQTGKDSQTVTKDFADDKKCMKAAFSLIEKTREKGYMETLPEYSEWNDTNKEYAIWRNTEAIEFIIKTLKENSKAKRADMPQQEAEKALDELLDNAKDLEICLSFDHIRIRMMAKSKYPYELELFFDIDMYIARTPYWAMRYDSVSLEPDEKFKQLIADYFVKNKKGKWFDKAQEENSVVEQEAKQKREDAYVKKLRQAVNKQYKSTYPYLSIGLSSYYLSEKANDDVLPVIFDVVKSKVKNNYEEVLTKVYYMLYDIKRRLPLARLKEVLNDLKAKKEISIENIYKDLVFESWETGNILKKLEIDPTNKEDIKNTAAYIAENIETYILQLRFLLKLIYIYDKTNKKREPLEEDFFELTLAYPELEEYVATYVEKITEHNKVYPAFKVYSGSASKTPIPVGVVVAAVLAIFNGPKYDKLIADFLRTIEHMDWFKISCSTMKDVWKRHEVTPDMPETFSVFPK